MRPDAPLRTRGELTLLKNPGTPELEVIQRKGITIERSRVSERALNGQGQRLGAAYRLEPGEVVYVPDSGTR